MNKENVWPGEFENVQLKHVEPRSMFGPPKIAKMPDFWCVWFCLKATVIMWLCNYTT